MDGKLVIVKNEGPTVAEILHVPPGVYPAAVIFYAAAQLTIMH
jgi:hypothetical protein